MYSSLIFSCTGDWQILPTMHHDSEFPISLISNWHESETFTWWTSYITWSISKDMIEFSVLSVENNRYRILILNNP